MIIYTATGVEWENIKEQTEFVSDDFDTEGFIHCSYPKQAVWVLNKHYRNEDKVLLLCINPKLLKSKLINEDLKGLGEMFPHVYGSINTDSIVKVMEIYPSTGGLFYENDELRDIIQTMS